jgi:glycosyltransferase involved in cell wall biosynthesis
MQAGKPILYNIDSGNKPVDEARCGISVSPGKTNELVDAIEKFAAMSPEERNELGMNGKNYVLQHHSYSKLATHLISCLED